MTIANKAVSICGTQNLRETALPLGESVASADHQHQGHADLVAGSALPALMVLAEYAQSKVPLSSLINTLNAQAKCVSQGDMELTEAMLINQAVALQAMFADLATAAKKQSTLQGKQIMTQLALKAQTNCRATLQALVEAKQPRHIAFVRQTNVAHHQQVNNGVSSQARAGENQSAQNELLVQAQDGSKTLDSRAKKSQSSTDATKQAMVALKRSQDR